MKIIPANIKNIRVESLSGQSGDALKKIWNAPVKLHAIAEIGENKTSGFNLFYKLFCKVMNKNGDIIDNGLEFIHGNKGCKNPCKVEQLAGQDESQVVFTFEITKSGEYEVQIGNYINTGITTSFKIIKEKNEGKNND